MSLTGKQALFVSAYLGKAQGNATEAARLAGYSCAESSGKDCMRHPAITAAISAYVARNFATADQVLAELSAIAFAEWREFVDVRGMQVSMDLTSKVKALELLGKYHQLFIERHDVDVNWRDHRVIGIADTALSSMFQQRQKGPQA